ncbi:cytochrome P450 [Boeremia exigua]|uniref:cytochrome P450 n=1 Tax=Boeremia exigua TaxID=749465 RepID=UPI001E8CDE2F|nr:cytochrome P450 [Boeremia exigua]KAH6625627.1 cytochrome P450 [Boeremia exigua]
MLDAISQYDSRDLIIAALVVFVSYAIGNAVYQLYFSPLSKFPGPKIAAVTLWYEIYYDVFKWGRYWVEVQKMHEEYGPIVRISPSELHVADLAFIDTLYTRSAPRDKHSFMTRQFGNDDTTFSTTAHAHHRLRRAALNPFFSTQRIAGLQAMIWTHVEKLCARFDEYAAAAKPLPAGDAFACLTADIIIEYTMGLQQNALDAPDFAPLFTQAVKKFASMGVYAKHMPWIHALTHALPQHWIARVSPEYGAMLAFRHMNNDRVAEVFARHEKRDAFGGGGHGRDAATATVFDALLTSPLPPAEKNLQRLSQESQLLVGAALDTTAHALTTTLYHLLAHPTALRTLRAELLTLGDPRAHHALPALEALPYLTAVLNEGLRLSHGLACRNARIAHTPLAYGGWVIPAGTPVGMSAQMTHFNADIFPEPLRFWPERWLTSSSSAPNNRPLKDFLMAFGRGGRQCVGMGLARAEMGIVIAAIVGRFPGLRLCEGVGREEVDLVHDLFLPGVKAGGKGVRVMVA